MQNIELQGIKENLERALSERAPPELKFRLGIYGGNELELRLEFKGGEKYLLPILWSESPISVRGWENHEFLDRNTLILSPTITDRTAKVYRDVLGANHADLNGRLYLELGTILIDWDPREQQRFPEFNAVRREEALFSNKASRIIRLFLADYRRLWISGDLREEAQGDRLRLWKQNELEQDSGISRGYVSRILQALVDQGYVEKKGLGGRSGAAFYYLKDKERLLDDWQKEDNFRKRVMIVEYSVLEADPVRIASSVRDALDGQKFAFTQWFAAWLRRPTTTPPIVSLYVPSSVLEWFDLGRRVSSGGNLQLLVAEDEGVFQYKQKADGFPLVCDVQIYLDLISMGNRGPEAARALREWEGFGLGEI